VKINFPNATGPAVPVGSLPSGACFMKIGADLTREGDPRRVYMTCGKSYRPAAYGPPLGHAKVIAVILCTGNRATLRPEELVTPVEAELNVISIGRKPE